MKNAEYGLQFILFPTIFSNGFLFNSLPNNTFLDWSKLKTFADIKTNVTEKLKYVNFWEGQKTWEKEEMLVPAFSPFPNVFSKGFYFY